MYTRQEVLNKLKEHFITNDNPPGWSGNFCVYYNTDNGAKCAIGAVLPDAEAYAAIGYGIEDIANGHAEARHPNDETMPQSIFDLIKDCGRAFLKDIQDAHDDAARDAHRFKKPELFKPDFIQRMQEVAKTWDLTW